MNMEIRQAELDDLDGLVRSLSPDPSREQILNRLKEAESGYRSMLVAVGDGTLAGTVSYQVRSDDECVAVRLFALDVGQDHRRKRIGTQLVRAVEHEAVNLNAGSVTLEVAVDNIPATDLYSKLGYSQAGDLFLNKWQQHTVSGIKTVREVSVRMTKRIAD